MKLVCTFLLLLPAVLCAAATPQLPARFAGVGIEQKLNAPLPLDTVFRDEANHPVALKTYFDNKPVLLVFMYFRCPMLCSQIMHGVVAGLRPLSLVPGKDFQVVAISFDPADTPADAAQEQARYSQLYSSHRGRNGWHFLTGTPDAIRAVTQAAGFHYHWDPQNKIFVHASGIMIATPDGRLSRYLYGVNYEPKDLKLSLVESSNGRISSPVDQILLFCYHYDPKTGKYGAVVLNSLHGAAIATLILMAIGAWIFWRRDLREHRS